MMKPSCVTPTSGARTSDDMANSKGTASSGVPSAATRTYRVVFVGDQVSTRMQTPLAWQAIA